MGRNFIRSFLRPILGPVCSTPPYAIYFSLWVALNLKTMQMITHRMLWETILKILFSNFKMRQKLFFSGLRISN